VGVGQDVRCVQNCLAPTSIASRPSRADNEALSTSLSSQLTAAGTNGIVLTPPPRPSAGACYSFDNLTKADQSADTAVPPPPQRQGPPTRPLLCRPGGGGGVTAATVRLGSRLRWTPGTSASMTNEHLIVSSARYTHAAEGLGEDGWRESQPSGPVSVEPAIFPHSGTPSPLCRCRLKTATVLARGLVGFWLPPRLL